MTLRAAPLLVALLLPLTSGASTYISRITLGAFLSNETFSDPLDGQTANDFAVISTRFYLKETDLGPERLEAVADLRDKHDFFDKLSRETLTLNGANSFQLRQLSVKLANERGAFYGTLGRFPITEAGSVNLDGVEAGYRWNPVFRTSLFGGLNPKRPDQTDLKFNSDSQTFGLYSLFQPRTSNWNNFFHFANAGVAETVQGHLDRAYVYTNLLYQWGAPNQISVMAYVDFTPRTYLQTLYFSGVQEVSGNVLATGNLLLIDTIEYSRRQGVLETLSPSPYKEAAVNLRHKFDSSTSMLYSGSWGIRSSDALIRREYSLGPVFSKLFSPHFSGQAMLGFRRNFTSDEYFSRLSAGYYSKNWEVTLDQEFNYHVESATLIHHPMLTELGLANFLSRELYASLSFQRAHDERVDILTTFFKIGYRMGSDPVSPLRDGAPPRGKL